MDIIGSWFDRTWNLGDFGLEGIMDEFLEVRFLLFQYILNNAGTVYEAANKRVCQLVPSAGYSVKSGYDFLVADRVIEEIDEDKKGVFIIIWKAQILFTLKAFGWQSFHTDS